MCKSDMDVKVCLENVDKTPMIITFINSFIKYFKENIVENEERYLLDQVFRIINSFASLGYESKTYLLKF